MKYKPFPPGLLEIQIHHTTAYNLCTVNTHYFQIYYINLLIFYDNFLLSLKSEFPASGFPPGGFSAISHYSPSVCSAAGDERFFTIQSLRQGGHPYTPPARTQRLVLRLPHPVLPESTLHQQAADTSLEKCRPKKK